MAKAGPYRGLSIEEALALLAERVEEQVSKEHAQWVRGSTELNGATPSGVAGHPVLGGARLDAY